MIIPNKKNEVDTAVEQVRNKLIGGSAVKDRIRVDFEEIDVSDYLRVIWKRRWLIVIGVVAATLTAMPASYVMRQYESCAILRLSEEFKKEKSEMASEQEKGRIIVTLPEYKIYSASFMDSKSFIDYLTGQKIFPAEQESHVEKNLQVESSLKKYIMPVYAYANEEILALHPQEQFISALQITWASRSPELAQRVVEAMSLFARDAIEQKVLERYVTGGYQEAYILAQELENKVANYRFLLKQVDQKLTDLKKIAQHSPAAAQHAGREVVSVDQGGHLYLPLPTQIVATEVTITDTKLNINDTVRRQKINRVNLELFTKLKSALAEKGSKSLFERLEGVRETFFQGKDLNEEEILLVRNEVSVDFARFEHRFRDVMQLVAGPGPTVAKKAKPSTSFMVGVAFIIGLFFFTLLALFLEFIQQSQQEMLTKGKTKRKI